MRSTKPESIRPIVVMDSGLAAASRPLMTVLKDHARFFGLDFCCMYDRSTALMRRW